MLALLHAHCRHHDWPLLPIYEVLYLAVWSLMFVIPSCAGMDPRGCGGPPMGMAQPGRGGVRGPGATVEGDRWGKRALPPPPPGTGGPAMSNLPALHKTDNKFKVGCAPPPPVPTAPHPQACTGLSPCNAESGTYARSRRSYIFGTFYTHVRVLAQICCMWFIHARLKALQ